MKHRLWGRLRALERRLTPRPPVPFVCFMQRGETETEALARHYAAYGGAGAYLVIAPPLLTKDEWIATYGDPGTMQ